MEGEEGGGAREGVGGEGVDEINDGLGVLQS